MSDSALESHHDTDRKAKESVQSYQSVWLARWTRTSCNETAEPDNHTSNPLGIEEIHQDSKHHRSMTGLEIATDISGSANQTLRMSSKNTRSETSCGKFLSLAGPSSNYGNSSASKLALEPNDMQSLRSKIGYNLEYDTAVECTKGVRFPSLLPGIPAANETSSRECRYLLEDSTAKNPPEWLKTQSAARDCIFAAPSTLQDNVAVSSSLVPYKSDHAKYGFDNGKVPVSSFTDRSILFSTNQLPNANLRILDHEHSLRKSNASLLLDVPSTSDNHLPAFGKEWFEKMHNSSGIRLFPIECSVSENPEFEKSQLGHYSIRRLPYRGQDVETTRMHTTVDSADARGCPRFSQTTHSLLITKKTDVNTSKENENFRKSRAFTEPNENISSGLHSTSPFVSQGQRGLKLQTLSSSTDSEEKENIVEDVKTSKVVIKYESSAETDTMDVDSFKEKNQFSGVNSASSNKVINWESNLSLQINVASSKEVGGRLLNTELPDINLELPALLPAASSSDNAGPSSSRTESLDMDVLLAHAEQPSILKPGLCKDHRLKTDPSSRWVKRLKVSDSDSSARGTKSSSDLDKNSSHEKLKRRFGKNLTDSLTRSEQAVDKHHGKLKMMADNIGDLPRKGTPSLDSSKEAKRLLLSHAWIQRWLRKGSRSSQKKAEALVVCEPQSSKLEMEDLQTKQFPSIAAMALMGKAMSGFEPCKFQKRGGSVTWNTRAF